MKKLVLCMFAILLCSAVLTGCVCEHEWVDANCTAAKTCSKCAEAEGEELGHIWEDATRESPKTCSRCGETEGDRLSLQEAYPDGQLRFENGRFLMNTDDLLDLYVLELQKNDFNFKKTDMFEERSEEYYVYYLQNSAGQTISVAVVTDLDTGLISMVSAGVPLDLDDLESTNSLMNAASIIFDACHGAMTDEKWEQINNSLEYSMNEVGYATRSFCDGLGYIAGFSTNHFEVVASPDMSNALMK